MNYSDKLSMPLSEFKRMSCEDFNHWRREHDFPRIFDFLVDALPNFLDWLEEQKNIDKADLLYHGPARFIRTYGYEATILHINSSFIPYKEHILNVFSRSDDDNHNRSVITRRQNFTSYFDWLLKSDFKDRLDVLHMFSPSGRTSSEYGNKSAHANISLNIPLHMPSARNIQELISQNRKSSVPKLELLKIEDDVGDIEAGWFLEKNLDFMNFNGLAFKDVHITSFNNIHYSTFDYVNFVESNFSQIKFYACLFCSLEFTGCNLYECDFLYGDTDIQFVASKIRRCQFISNSMKVELERSDIYDVGLIWGCFKDESTLNKIRFHHTCKLLYSKQGYPDLAGDHYYLERVSQRNNYLEPKGLRNRSFLKWFFDRVNGAYWGYGEKPYNIISFCMSLIFLISILNFFSSCSKTKGMVVYSFLISFQSFTNIKIVELSQNDPLLNAMLVFLSFLGVFSLGFLISFLSVKARKYN